MCIRDSPGGRGAVRLVVSSAQDPTRGRHDEVVAGAGDDRDAFAVHDRTDDPDPVSYTHLTLPTSDLV